MAREYTFRNVSLTADTLSSGGQTITFSTLNTSPGSLEGVNIPTLATAPVIDIQAKGNRQFYVSSVTTSQFVVKAGAVGEALPVNADITVRTFETGASSGTNVQANEMFARLARDPQFYHYHSQLRHRLRSEVMRHILHHAEIQYLKDTKCVFKEQDITLAADARSVLLPSDFMIPVNITYKESGDDALAEGLLIQIVDQEELL